MELCKWKEDSWLNVFWRQLQSPIGERRRSLRPIERSQCVQVKYCICEVYVLLWSLIYLHACARIQLCCLILMGIVYYSWIFRFINDLHLYFFCYLNFLCFQVMYFDFCIFMFSTNYCYSSYHYLFAVSPYLTSYNVFFFLFTSVQFTLPFIWAHSLSFFPIFLCLILFYFSVNMIGIF